MGRLRRTTRAEATDAHRAAALAVLREEAGDALARGDAELVIDEAPHALYGSPTYRLVPRNPKASPVEVNADRSGTYLHVGHDAMLHELWRTDVEQRRGELRECVAAVVAGRYEEHREPWKRGTRLTMTFEGPTRRVVVTHHLPSDEPSSGTTTYEPY